MTGRLDVPAVIIPTSKIPGVGGMAAAFAGEVDVAIDGGSADFGFGVAESGLHYSTHNSAEGDSGSNLGLIEFEGDGHLNYEAAATTNASLELVIDMPDLGCRQRHDHRAHTVSGFNNSSCRRTGRRSS